MAKDKKKKGTSRNNAVFRVVGAKVSKQSKGKPKEVGMKLKKITNRRVKDDVESLDTKLASLKKSSVKLSGEMEKISSTSVEPIKSDQHEVDLDSLTESFSAKAVSS